MPVLGISWHDAVVWCNALTEYVNATDSRDLKCVYVQTDIVQTPIRNADISKEENLKIFDDLNSIIRTKDFLQGKNGFALPTESQWEYAARYLEDDEGVQHFMHPNKVSGDFDLYKTSDSTQVTEKSKHFAVANLTGATEFSDMLMEPVGEKIPNFVDIHNMNGNLSEWCFDWFDDYSSDPKNDPLGPEEPKMPLYEGYKAIRGGSFTESLLTMGTAFRGKQHSEDPDIRVGFRVCRNNIEE